MLKKELIPHTSAPWQQQILQEYLRCTNINKNSLVLDAACGIGNNLNTIKHFSKNITALELSISSPIQNTSGVIVALLFIIFFKEHYDYSFYIALVSIFTGIIILSIIGLENNKKDRKEFNKKNTFQKILQHLIYLTFH